MNVKELIKKLKKCDPDAMIRFSSLYQGLIINNTIDSVYEKIGASISWVDLQNFPEGGEVYSGYYEMLKEKEIPLIEAGTVISNSNTRDGEYR